MERKTFIDVAKGIAMILVVMQHIGAPQDIGLQFLCKLDVPIFFLCSGWLAYKQNINLIDSLKKAFTRLLVPFILACLAASMFYKENCIEIFISSGKHGYWFWEALFLMFIIFWGIYRTTWSLIGGAIIVEIALLAITKYAPDSINDILVIPYLSRYFPCFIAGSVLRLYNMENINKWVSCSFLCIALVGLAYSMESTNISFIFHVCGYLCGAVIAFFVIKGFEHNLPCNRWIGYVGRYSLNVYILHFYFVPYIPRMSDWFIVNLALVLTIAIMVVIISIVVGKILTYTTPLDKVLTP